MVQPQQPKEYRLVDVSDGRINIILDAETEEDAITEMLTYLGWRLKVLPK